MNLEELAVKAAEVCKQQGWTRNWSAGGCYLHLEASEFIEALRGKGSSPPAEEAADVLFVLLSMCQGNGVALADVVRIFHEKCDALLGAQPSGVGP